MSAGTLRSTRDARAITQSRTGDTGRGEVCWAERERRAPVASRCCCRPSRPACSRRLQCTGQSVGASNALRGGAHSHLRLLFCAGVHHGEKLCCASSSCWQLLHGMCMVLRFAGGDRAGGLLLWRYVEAEFMYVVCVAWICAHRMLCGQGVC